MLKGFAQPQWDINLYTVSVYSFFFFFFFFFCHVVHADEARCNPGVWALFMLMSIKA